MKNILNRESGKVRSFHLVALFIFLVVIVVSFIFIILDDRKPDKVTLDLKSLASEQADGVPEAPSIDTELLQPDAEPIVNNKPVAQFTVTTPVVIGERVEFTDLSYDTDIGDTIVNSHWEGKKDFYTKAGQYTVTLKVQDDQGNWSEPVSHVVHVVEKEADKYNMPPIAMFKATNPVYVGETVIYEDASYDPDGGQIVDRVWTGKQDSFSRAGSYTVTLKVQDDQGKWSDPLYQVVVVQEKPVVEVQRKPVALFTATTPVYVGQTVTYTNKSFDQDGDKLIKVEWGGDKRATYNKPGKYDVTLRVQDEHGEWSDKFTRTVEVIDSPNNPPVAQFTATSPVRVGETVTYKNTSYDTDGTIAREQWGGDKRIKYDKEGTYSVTLTVWDDRGAKSSVTKQIIVQSSANVPPVAKFHTNAPVHVQERVYWYDDSYDTDGKIVKVSWSGDKRDSYDKAGIYTVTLTVTDDKGATSKYTQTVTILDKENKLPVAQISGPTVVKVNTTAIFRDESYDPDGYITSTTWGSKTISKTWVEPGVYTVDLTVTDNNGGKKKVAVTVYVTEDGYPPSGS